MLCEDTEAILTKQDRVCLNPCFTGICSASQYESLPGDVKYRLNPCFTGICSASKFADRLYQGELRGAPLALAREYCEEMEFKVGFLLKEFDLLK